MEEKEIPVLSDKQIKPTDELIFSIIGDRKSLWHSIMDHIKENYNDAAGEWNYYNDGKRWLFKLIRKKKTIFWISLIENTFRVTFWFGDKAESLIEGSELPDNIKNEFKTAKRYGYIRGVTITMDSTDDVDNAVKLIEIKVKVK